MAKGAENLIPGCHKLTVAEQSAGGKASGAARRRKKTMRQAAELYLSLPVTNTTMFNKMVADGLDMEDIDNQMAIIVGLSKRAMTGDTAAAKTIFALLGAEIDRDEVPDDGFIEALKSEAGDVWGE